MLEPISKLHSQNVFGSVRFGAAPGADDDRVIGEGPKRRPAGAGKAQPVTGEDRVEITHPAADEDAETEADDAGSSESKTSKNVRYHLGFLLEDIAPFALGFVSIGSGPIGWAMFPVLGAAGYGLSRVGRRLKKGVDESEVTGIAARVLRMKKMFANPQMLKSGEALGTLESTIGVVCNPIFAMIKGFPGGTKLLEKLGLVDGIKLSGAQGLGRFITEKALDRAMVFSAAAEGKNVGDAMFRGGKMGMLLGAGNWIAKAGETMPGPFKWIFRLIGLALPLFGLKKPDDAAKGPTPQAA